VNYKKKQTGVLFMKHCVDCNINSATFLSAESCTLLVLHANTLPLYAFRVKRRICRCRSWFSRTCHYLHCD